MLTAHANTIKLFVSHSNNVESAQIKSDTIKKLTFRIYSYFATMFKQPVDHFKGVVSRGFLGPFALHSYIKRLKLPSIQYGK